LRAEVRRIAADRGADRPFRGLPEGYTGRDAGQAPRASAVDRAGVALWREGGCRLRKFSAKLGGVGAGRGI